MTIVAGYLTRLSLVEANAWVTHTDEVKLAIADGELALLRGNADAQQKAEANVGRLTIDNERQQQNLVRARVLAGQGSQKELEELFTAMQREEDRLMVPRLNKIESARRRSSAAFVVGAVLTLVLGAIASALLSARRHSLAAAHRAVAWQRALLEGIIESVDEGIIAVEPSRKTIAINAAARSMVGAAFPLDRVPDDWRPHIRATYEDGSEMLPEDGPLARAIRGEIAEDVVYCIHRDGDPSRDVAGVWVSTSARPIREEGGRVLGAVATLRDITAQRATAERLRELSLTDELTGLLNRRGFLTAASAWLAVARRTRDPVALLYADVNGLKRINDELGHEQGDRTIEDAARVLRGLLRNGDIVARIGGDEFVALLPNFSPAAREPLLERLAAAIRSQAEHEMRPYRLSVSAAVTFMDWEAGQSLDDLLAQADRSMYERKRARAGLSVPMMRTAPAARDGRET
jgi:diguanylate cyclase (GGDEF)-like protein